jgi:hypothetical protein
MSKAFVPSFNVAAKANVKFSTNNPLGEDRKSLPVTIVELTFNETTRSIEVVGSDSRKRQCRIDRITNEADLKALTKRLQTVYDKQTRISFVAAGGNDPNVWFYTIVDAA